MKRLLLSISALFFLFSAHAQLVEDWRRDVQEIDVNNGSKPVLKWDDAGDLVVVGGGTVYKYDTLGTLKWTFDLDGVGYHIATGKGNSHLTLDADDNIYVVTNKTIYNNGYDTVKTVVITTKVSPTGQQEWSTEYRYDSLFPQDVGKNITVRDNSVYITGQSQDSIQDCDLFLVRYNAQNGNEVWRTTFHDQGNDCDRGDIVLAGDSGNVYVGGKSRTTQNNEYTLVKFDSTGTQLWDARYEVPGRIFHLFTDMILTNDQRVVMSGHYYGTVCFSAGGTQLWDYMPQTYLPTNVTVDRVTDMDQFPNGDILLTGYHSGPGGSSGEVHMLTIRLSPSGQEIWSNRFDVLSQVQQSELAQSAFIDENNDVYVAGWAEIDHQPNINGDFMIKKVNGNDGSLYWSYVDNQNLMNPDEIYSMVISGTQKVYVAGTNFTGLENQLLVKKYYEDPISVGEITGLSQHVTLTPNPSQHGQVRLVSEVWQNHTGQLEIIDPVGRMVFASDTYVVGTPIDLPSALSGLYLVRLQIEGQLVTRRLVVGSSFR